MNRIFPERTNPRAAPGETSGMWADPYAEAFYGCPHPDHEPPMLMHIPMGKVYVHICPGCCRKYILRGQAAAWA